MTAPRTSPPEPRLTAPTAVAVVDVEAPPTELTFVGADGTPYRAAMLLLRRGGRPFGVRVLELDDRGRLPAGALAAPPAAPPCEPSGTAASVASPAITVVVTTCANAAALVRCVAAILACGYAPLEVVVVENRPDGSPTATELAERFGADARVRHVEEPRAGLSYARNAGLAHATGELVVFTDDDVIVDPGWLRAIAAAFAGGAGCVTGLIMPLAIDTPAQALFEQFAGFGKGFARRTFRLAEANGDPLFPYAAGSFGSGANTALRASVARRLGGFDVRLGAGTPACGGEDLDMYIRLLLAGEQIVYEPAALVFHEHPAQGSRLRRRGFDYGVGLTAMLTKQLLAGPRLPLLRAVPAGIRYIRDADSRKNASRGADYPRRLTALERLGMLAGPFAYASSRRRARRVARAAPSPSASGATRSRRIAHASAPPPVAFVPGAVAAIELEHGLADLELGRSGEGVPYGSVLALVRLHGDPLALVEVPAVEGRVAAARLAEAVWPAVREPLAAHLARERCLPAEALAPEGLVHGAPAPRRPCPERRVDAQPPPFASVIVPTAGRPDRIATCLDGLRGMRYAAFEIVVVDNAPDDPRTREVVTACGREDPRVRYVAEPLPGSSVARNRGVAEARGELLAFTDDDVVVDPEWLAWIVEPFLHDERVGVVTGLVLPARFDTPDQRWFEELSGFGKGLAPRLFDRDEHRADERLLYPYWGGVFGSGNSMAFRPELLRRIGGFDPALGAGSRARAGADIESFSHAILAGARLAYEPRAVCWHDHRAGAAAVERQMFNYGVGLTAILTKWLLRDPRLAWTIVRQGAALALPARADERDRPQELTRLRKQLRMNRSRRTLGRQVRGYCAGPLLYVRSVVWARRLRLRAVLDGGKRR
jgi:GT2 family glycosyltransferase